MTDEKFTAQQPGEIWQRKMVDAVKERVTEGSLTVNRRYYGWAIQRAQTDVTELQVWDNGQARYATKGGLKTLQLFDWAFEDLRQFCESIDPTFPRQEVVVP